ncbi:MAG: substrate-binding domain-containing protein [Planctomycetes bacterium]|nr:substrate-binding domain-containing protein [Planctomycetota bacterium]
MKKLLFTILVVSLASLVCVVGCSRKTPASDADSPVKYKIGMSQCNLGEPWRVQMNADVKNAAEEYSEIEVIFKDAQNDTLKQRSHMEEFISAGVDIIIISPKESVPLVPIISQAYKNGIPVIILDRKIIGDDYTCFIGADNIEIGKAAGKWIAANLQGKGKVIELKGLMTTIAGQDRNSGFRQGIKDSDIEIIFEADMKWLEPNARKEMESALSRFEKIDLVYAHNDPGAHGAYLAAKAAGREKEIKFVGIDGLPQEGQIYVKQGVLAATFEYPTGGREAIEAALKLLAGQEVPKKITLPSKIYTPENIDQGGQHLK